MKSYQNIQNVLERKSFPLFLSALRNFVDTKEWSEVGGVFHVCRQILTDYNPEVVFDIGCGKRPTLALMMVLNYKRDVYAVDPQLDTTYCEGVRNIFLYNTELKEFAKLEESHRYSNALVLANHSHVSTKHMSGFLSRFRKWVYVTVPCCVDNKLTGKVGIHIKDVHMHTDKNDVYTYASSPALLSGLFNTKGKDDGKKEEDNTNS